jgi:hypothetical protein
MKLDNNDRSAKVPVGKRMPALRSWRKRDKGFAGSRKHGEQAMSGLLKNLVDTWLIYPSSEDPGLWVAHSLNTDQMAVGKSKLEAYVALKAVVRALLEAASEDEDIQVFCPASEQVRAMLPHAKPLDQGLLDRAEEILARRDKKTSAKWPRMPSGTCYSPIDIELINE